MIIMIPSTEYGATVQGSVNRDVTCERCGHQYVYSLVRIATGSEKVLFSSAKGPEKALKKAQAKLAKVLETDHDDVPCPSCEWHQSIHIDSVRNRSYPQLKSLAGAFFIFAGLAFGLFLFCCGFLLLTHGPELPKASALVDWSLIILVLASPGILLRGLRSLLLLNYRPNGSSS